jgi:hypothetical protein
MRNEFLLFVRITFQDLQRHEDAAFVQQRTNGRSLAEGPLFCGSAANRHMIISAVRRIVRAQKTECLHCQVLRIQPACVGYQLREILGGVFR